MVEHVLTNSTQDTPEFLVTKQGRLRRFASIAKSNDEQVCLVTGAARGLGNEFCRAFLRSCVLIYWNF
jgi:hypothetical protein